MQICEREKCTGCFACMNICPKDAITVQTDVLGKTIPIIDENKCISCGVCNKVCPVNCAVEQKMPEHTYAVWSVDEYDCKFSSSGGAASVFARRVLENGGAVYGAASIDGAVKHIKIADVSELEMLRGSKYVQSSIGYIYRDVKNELKNGRKVLFTGTPCQIAGLKGYLQKENENLITVDLICHGTPPETYLNEHIQDVTNNSQYDSVAFRGKYDYYLTVENKGKIKYQRKRDLDTYFQAFADGLILRDNCYSCRYACPDRCADLTIGDFWGIDRSTLKNPYKGRISLVMTNTKKGMDFFEECKDRFVCEERTLKEAMNPEQGNLLHPSVPHNERQFFVRNYPVFGFEKTMKKTKLGKAVNKNYIKSRVNKLFVIRALRKIKRIFV